MAEIAYKTVGDYQIPDLTIPTEEHRIGKYGQMRRTYLREHRKPLYSILMMKGELFSHLEEVDRTATEQIEQIVAQMAAQEGVTETMKAKDPLRWTGLMNNFLHSAEEIILPELVYN